MREIGTRRADTPRLGLAPGLALYALLAFVSCGVLVALQDPAFAIEGAATAAPLAVAINVIPALIAALLLLALTRRPVLSLGVVLLMLYLLYVANTMKLELLDTPVLPADFVLLTHLGAGGALLLRYVPATAIAGLVASVLCVLALLRWERPWARLHGLRRLALLAIVLALGASLLSGVQPWSNVYAADGGAYLAWSPAVSARRSGLSTTLLRYTWETAFVLPEPDHALAQTFIRTHASAPLAAGDIESPDIVIVQSESFFDPARLRGFEPEQVLPQFRRLASGARHGDLWVPTYGGGTIRTEFEVLTGIAMRYFPDMQYPYFRLTATAVPSLASLLAARGYHTIAVHPHERDFWNRASALSHMGFDEFDGDETFGDAARVGFYISDEALVDHILRRLDGASGPVLLFAISMENHGPYEAFPNADPAQIAAQPVPAGVSGLSADRLRGYLYHLAAADHSLGRLADALRKRSRRTLLLFYGDHLPGLPRLYDEAGFDDGGKGPDQPVPWLLLDTAQAEAPSTSEATTSFYLPALLLAAAGIDDRGYFAALEAARHLDQPAAHWTPAEDNALQAVMRLRQRGEVK